MLVAGQSNRSAAQNVYGLAAVLFVLVLLAGVLMISGSMNSNLAQRIRFFGMMRCIGMSKAQIKRFVRLEALNRCKTALPIGVLLGTFVSRGICAAQHYGIGGEFSTTPVFQISMVGIVSGVAVGIVTVLLAAEAPARRAARGPRFPPCVAPPLAVWEKSSCRWVHHALADKKGMLLLTGSFALSIVLALCFSVLLTFAGLLLPGQIPWQPDLLLNGYDNELVLTRSMAEQLRALPGVEAVWGATALTDTPVSCPQKNVDKAVLGSYDDFMMKKSAGYVVAGRMADRDADSGEVMTIYNKNNPLSVGDTVSINGRTLTVVGAFSQGMFPDDVTVICPQPLFDSLVGEKNYAIIAVLLDGTATEQTVLQIARLANDEIVVSDVRQTNLQENATYLASRIVGYGFLAIIGLISLCNIVNSISMSVSARIRQYGILRAVGMDARQTTRMIATEALTYGLSGLVAGSVLGLPLYRLLFTRLITRYFGIAWSVPWGCLGVIVCLVAAAVAVAVYAPAKRICTVPITTAVNGL